MSPKEQGLKHASSVTRASRLKAALGRAARWMLVTLVLGLALIGFLHLTRGTALRHVRGVAADGAAISVGEPEFPLMATMATGAWLAPGNRIEVMQNGDGTFPRLWDELRSAQRSIDPEFAYVLDEKEILKVINDRRKASAT